ncbi:hypothetical protein [Bacteroides sp.]|uniref:hypothetical protein n=1 Tax=Bacteroides sp. TaxID=29523 RepID=UPI002A832FC4|nr:hypothetical protein [Bacteroides sp.]
MRAADVFIAGGMPRVTYNPRNDLKLEDTLKDYMDNGYKLISVTGPTKSGKTVLVNKVISTDNCISISGGSITQDSDFWNIILDELEVFIPDSQTVAELSKETTTATVSTGLNILGFGAKAGLAGGDEEERTKGHSFKRPTSLKQRAIKALEEKLPVIIIDDFHYIQQSVQQQIIRAIKQPIFNGLRVIIIAVPHRAYDALKVETEMTGRVTQLSIKLWEPEELKQIAYSGFKELNVSCSDEIISMFAKESFGSPNLMQEFCLRLCKKNNIFETQEEIKELVLSNENEFFEDVVNSVTSKVAFERLAKGPRQRADRIQRKLKSGEIVDIYSAILHAIAETGPSTVITYEELRKSLRSVMQDDLPKGNEITRVLSKMDEIAKTLQGEPVIDWDKDDTRLFISDPYFAFYLKWAVRSRE